MPVLVTCAHRPFARRLALRLLEEGGEVRVHGDGGSQELRAAGAFVATGDPDDEGRLEAAMADVHTVVHVGRGVLAEDPEAVVTEAAVVARAASGAAVRRLIVLSVPGADEAAADPLRRAAGRVESLTAAAAPPSIAVRASLPDAPEVRDVLATAGLGPDLRTARVAPVQEGDLVELVVAFDRARSRAATGHLVVAADGPWRATVTEYLERVGAGFPGSGRLVGRRLADPARPCLLLEGLAGPWWSEDPLVLDGWSFAGIVPAAPEPAP